ncbi:hypothetical protein LUZ60_017102 [Juncus effusus]|nr:hypothetical protein LUZ60_017102 [Juncus effusus]
MAEVAELFLFHLDHLDEFLDSAMSSASDSHDPESEPEPDRQEDEFGQDVEEIYEASFFFQSDSFFPPTEETEPFEVDPPPQESDGLEGLEGLRVIGLDSDSGSEASEIEPFRWDSIGIEEEEGRNDGMADFDWEEVEGGLQVDDRDLLSMMAGNTYLETSDEEEAAQNQNPSLQIEGEIHVDLETVRNIGWEEVLLSDGLDQESESVVDSVHMSEYEILAGQIETAIQRGCPPAAKCVVKSLPSITLTEEDLNRDQSSCAVCKDEMVVKEKITKLPCNHLYHKDCILPWLKIRNTCPVCRYELATDDPDYENWKAFRNDGSGSDLIAGLVESIDSFHLDWSV